MRRRIARPPPLELFWGIWGGETRSLRSIAREYGVSHTLVRSWCDELDVPYPSLEEVAHINMLRRKAEGSKRSKRSVTDGARQELEDYLHSLWQSHGCGVFLATHDRDMTSKEAYGVAC